MILPHLTVIAALLLTAGVAGQAVAQAPPVTKATTAEAALRQSSQAFAEAFNQGDANAVAALWTEDGDYIDEAGRTFAGRKAIEKSYAAFFAAHPGVKIKVVVDSIKLLGDSAAIEDGRAFLEPAPGAPAISKYTAAHVKIGSQWLMATVRDSRIELPSGYSKVADLEWLIGQWIAEEHGTKTESHCRWVANKSFVERKYTTTSHDGIASAGVQLIGWNAHGGHVQSWNFSPDGGHAIGIWTPREGGWEAEIRGATGDGVNTTATNILTKLDDNAYAWQSINRTAGGQPLPDSDEVIVKRNQQ
ncbi:MAG TPA: SgcJ/EcaC family oxidoreductase [Pirellulaceae bacterium]|nr:SgcJ/EcaC family oxidoreductase [Pirellulaceae bacterium]